MRLAVIGLMVVAWLALVAFGADQLGKGLDGTFTNAAARIDHAGRPER